MTVGNGRLTRRRKVGRVFGLWDGCSAAITLSLRPAQRPASERDGTEGNGE